MRSANYRTNTFSTKIIFPDILQKKFDSSLFQNNNLILRPVIINKTNLTSIFTD